MKYKPHLKRGWGYLHVCNFTLTPKKWIIYARERTSKNNRTMCYVNCLDRQIVQTIYRISPPPKQPKKKKEKGKKNMIFSQAADINLPYKLPIQKSRLHGQ